MAAATKTPPGADPKQLERTGTVREIGSQAVWSLSSCKPGVCDLSFMISALIFSCFIHYSAVFSYSLIYSVCVCVCEGFGVDQLRDDNLETYWQSDGSQPHLVNIQFR